MKTGTMQQMNAFTVDLEDWFQGLTSTNPQIDTWSSFESRVVPITHSLLEILRDHKIQATFFVLGYLADQQPELVERIRADDHEIGVHGYSHRYVYRLTPDEFSRELEHSLKAVERITGEVPLGHRAPYFSLNASTLWAFNILKAQGFRYDSSVFPTRTTLYSFPDAPRFPYRVDGHDLMEFPLSTVRWGGINWPIAGGLYMRTLPYAFIRWGISHLNRRGHPAIMYVHPWELDLGQSYSRVTPRERITHYYGRRRLARKLNRLFTDFRFCSLSSLLQQYERYGIEIDQRF
jgi:polysaccharide deacetylase family protein (PEP-CTERM system associated)